MKTLLAILTLTALVNSAAVFATTENQNPDCNEHLQASRNATPAAQNEGDTPPAPAPNTPPAGTNHE